MAPDALTIRQVAGEMGITRQAVLAAIRDGRLTASVVEGQHRRCTRADVDAWLVGREQRRQQKVARRLRTARRVRLDNTLYEFIVAYKRERGGRCPTLVEMGEALGMKSKSAIHYRLKLLADDGRIVLEGYGGSHHIIIPGERWLAPGEWGAEERSEE